MMASPAQPPAPRDVLQTVVEDLAALDRSELPEQAEIYERMHTVLAAALARTVDQPDPGSGSR